MIGPYPSQIYDFPLQMAFTSRVRCHALWQSAEAELRRFKQSHEKARSQGRMSQERIGHSLAQIADVVLFLCHQRN